jgi:hypothetical protein
VNEHSAGDSRRESSCGFGRRSAGGRPDSPAAAFYRAFREATEGVRFASVYDDVGALTRVATGFRAAETAALASLAGEEFRWDPDVARQFAHALTLCAGNWMLEETGDVALLETELEMAWQEVLSSA